MMFPISDADINKRWIKKKREQLLHRSRLSQNIENGNRNVCFRNELMSFIYLRIGIRRYENLNLKSSKNAFGVN